MKHASLRTMFRSLARCQERDYCVQLPAACFAHAERHGDLTLCLYDVTTLSFEAENENDLRRIGCFKERRVDPQIVVGLLVDRAGFPLEVGCFEGNQAETSTILPLVNAFTERHGLAIPLRHSSPRMRGMTGYSCPRPRRLTIVPALGLAMTLSLMACSGQDSTVSLDGESPNLPSQSATSPTPIDIGASPAAETTAGQAEQAAQTLILRGVNAEDGAPVPPEGPAGLLKARIERLGIQGGAVTSGANGELIVELAHEQPEEVLSALTAAPSMRLRPVITMLPVTAAAPGPASSPTALAHEGYSGAIEVSAEVVKSFLELACPDDGAPETLRVDPSGPQVACDEDGNSKYLLEPAVHLGVGEVRQAASEQTSGAWQVEADLDIDGMLSFGSLTQFLSGQDPVGSMAFVEDQTVIFAPLVQSPILDGGLSLDGLDTNDAEAVTRWLEYNVSPWYFRIESTSTTAPTPPGRTVGDEPGWSDTVQVTVKDTVFDGYTLDVSYSMPDLENRNFEVLDATALGKYDVVFRIPVTLSVKNTTPGDRPLRFNTFYTTFGLYYEYARDSAVCTAPGDLFTPRRQDLDEGGCRLQVGYVNGYMLTGSDGTMTELAPGQVYSADVESEADPSTVWFTANVQNLSEEQVTDITEALVVPSGVHINYTPDDSITGIGYDLQAESCEVNEITC